MALTDTPTLDDDTREAEAAALAARPSERAEPAPRAAAAEREATEYIVMQQNEDGSWTDLPGTFPATNWQAAIRAATQADKATGEKPREGTFRAAPKRNIRGLRTKNREVVEQIVEEL